MASKYYDSVGKEVNDGDVAYASDLNDVNTATDSAFQIVESDVTALGVNIVYYEELAQKWAENPEDTEVEPGSYSALHWAAKANADAIATAADRVQTGLDVIAADAAKVAAELAETNAETAETNAELAETNAEAAQVAAELAETNAEAAQVAAELAETNAAASAALATNAAASLKNKIINGDFRISQRGNPFTVSGSYTYTLDRWCAIAAGADMTITQSSRTFPEGNSGIMVATGASGNTLCDMLQRIEGTNCADLRGKECILEFYVFTSDGTDVTVEARYANSIDTFATTTLISSAAIPTVALSYVKKSFIFTAPLDYSHYGIEIRFKFGALGASKQAALGKVRLYAGDTESDGAERSIAEERNLCHRYYEIGTVSGVAATYSTVYTRLNTIMFLARKRGAPVMTETVGPTFLGHAGTPGTVYQWGGNAIGFGVIYNWTTGTIGRAFNFTNLTYEADAEL